MAIVLRLTVLDVGDAEDEPPAATTLLEGASPSAPEEAAAGAIERPARASRGADAPGPARLPVSAVGPIGTRGRPAAVRAGEQGACEVAARMIENPRHAEGAAAPPVWIYEPGGKTEASVTGGRCDDDERPAVFVIHGYRQSDPASYQALIQHLVSVGNVVVFPGYGFDDGNRESLEESYRVVDAGLVAAVNSAPRIDTARVGWWGHSHGGGMVPFLVQQASDRGWGQRALWASVMGQAFALLVGAGDIRVPHRTRALVVAFQDDGVVDARLGIDAYESLLVPAPQKRHVTVHTDPASGFVADHGAPAGGNGIAVDAVDALLFRYADVLELCALRGAECAADLSVDAAGVKRATVTDDPVDVGPYPAVVAECDTGYGQTLNPRIERCGQTQVSV